jgi:hypothetical protein
MIEEAVEEAYSQEPEPDVASRRDRRRETGDSNGMHTRSISDVKVACNHRPFQRRHASVVAFKR